MKNKKDFNYIPSFEELKALGVEECRSIGEAIDIIRNTKYGDVDFDVLYDILDEEMYFTTQDSEGNPHNKNDKGSGYWRRNELDEK